MNQNNTLEKTSQIARMANIYNNASEVWVWLGGASERSPLGMTFVTELVQFENLHELLVKTDSDTLNKWDALEEVMRSGWFSRRWVIQELAVSRRASVWCGHDRVHWDDFADAVSIFKLHKQEIAKVKRQGKFKHAKLLAILEAFGAYVLVKEKTDILKQDREGRILERKRTLEELVSSFTAFDAGDPRDIIYAVTSIARSPIGESAAGQITADYDKSLLDVYVSFVQYAIKQSASLDIICRHWAPARTTLVKEARKASTWALVDTLFVKNRLPSWMKKLDESPFGIPDEIFGGRKYGDNFATLSARYNASGTLAASEQYAPIFGLRTRNNDITDEKIGTVLSERYDGTMKVRGLVLGQIYQLSSRMIPGHVLHEVLTMGGWESLLDGDHTVEEVPDKLWRTLVANRGPAGQPADISYRRSCLYAIQRRSSGGDIDLNAIINEDTTPTIVVQYLERVRDVVWNRKAFLAATSSGETTEDLFGLCSQKAKKGDHVCILYGCSVPVILRKRPLRPTLGQSLISKRQRRSEFPNSQWKVDASNVRSSTRDRLQDIARHLGTALDIIEPMEIQPWLRNDDIGMRTLLHHQMPETNFL